ncbi:MAG: class I SAM-dependent methyltransferase [Ignavibacteriae bacterium]|nr:class I SAM-dependent methyltransferase [Ignavibacteriota bacterium]
MKNYFNNIFDAENPKFVNAIDELPLWSAPFGLTLLDTVKLKPNIKALDIGCGTGFPLFELAGRLGESSKVYGIDTWKKAIEKVKDKNSLYELNNVVAVAGAAENLPFDNNYFDLIVSNNGINNVQDLDKTLSECYRVLKPDGQFIFTYNLPESMKEFYEVFESVLEGLGLLNEIQKMHGHIFDKRKPIGYMGKIVTKNNFKVIQKIENKFHFRFVNGTAFFNHTLFKFHFLPPWIKILPTRRVEEVFGQLEIKLNEIASKEKELVMTIPYVCFDCSK